MSNQYLNDLDKKAENIIAAIEEVKPTVELPQNEQELFEEWLNDLRGRGETEEEKVNRNEYLENLLKDLRENKGLKPPFNIKPPTIGPLQPFYYYEPEQVKQKKLQYTLKKIPQPKKKPVSGAGKQKKKEKPTIKPKKNLFEDPTEIARVIAKSKGLPFADFVAAVAKYTEDYGEALRSAMKIEVTEFRDYVNKVIEHRIKDMRKVMDEECNYESEKIKKDIEKWKNELANVRREVVDMIPEFDLDEYKTDRHYLTKIFTFDVSDSKKGGSFNNWKEECCFRLKWYSENTNKLAECNQQLHDEITCMRDQATELQHDETVKQQTHSVFISTESKHCLKLNQEIDALNKEILDMQKDMCALQKR